MIFEAVVVLHVLRFESTPGGFLRKIHGEVIDLVGGGIGRDVEFGFGHAFECAVVYPDVEAVVVVAHAVDTEHIALELFLGAVDFDAKDGEVAGSRGRGAGYDG